MENKTEVLLLPKNKTKPNLAYIYIDRYTYNLTLMDVMNEKQFCTQLFNFEN